MCAFTGDSIICDTISYDEWKKTIDELKNFGILFIVLTGGEPTYYIHFCELYEYIYKSGFYIIIKTNAAYINDQVKKTLLNYPPYKLLITLYGASDDTYEIVTSQRCFTNVLNALDFFYINNFNFQLSVTLLKINFYDLDNFFAIANKYDKKLHINDDIFPNIGSHNNFYDISLSPVERVCLHKNILSKTDDIMSKAIALKKRYTYKAKTFDDNTIIRFVKCYNSLIGFYIHYDGNMSYCPEFISYYVSPKIIGINNAWNDLQKNISNNFPLTARCEKCEYKKYCKANCPARFFISSGSLVIPDNLTCEYAFYNYCYTLMYGE